METMSAMLPKNVPNGKGRLIMGNGDIYEGDFVKGKRQGYGILNPEIRRKVRRSMVQQRTTWPRSILLHQ